MPASAVTITEPSQPVRRERSSRGFLTESEWDLWQEHLEQLGDLRYRNYPVFLIDELDKPLTKERIQESHVLVVRPEFTDQVTFPEWLGHEHLFDYSIAMSCDVLREAAKAFREYEADLAVLGYSDDTDSTDNTDDSVSCPPTNFTGEVFLLDKAYGKVVQSGIDDAEALRQLLFKALPDSEYIILNKQFDSISARNKMSRKNLLDPSMELTKRISIVREADMNPHMIGVDYETELKFSVLSLSSIIVYLATNVRNYFGSVAKFLVEVKCDQSRFSLKYDPFIGPFRDLESRVNLNGSTTDSVIEQVYTLDAQEGAFIFPCADEREEREKRVIRVGEMWIRASCKVIAANFANKIGERSTKYTYDTGQYSYEALRIFVDAIYRQPFPEQIKFETLFELYRLFAELGCTDLKFGLKLNCYLLTHLDQIANPFEIIQNVVECQPNYPELEKFTTQLSWLLRQVPRPYDLDPALAKFLGVQFWEPRDYLDFGRWLFRKYRKQWTAQTLTTTNFSTNTYEISTYAESRKIGTLYRLSNTNWVEDFLKDFIAQLPSLGQELFELDITVNMTEVVLDSSIAVYRFTLAIKKPTTPEAMAAV